MSAREADGIFALDEDQVALATRRALGDNIGEPAGPAAFMLLLYEFIYTEQVQDREQLLDAARRTVLPFLVGSDEVVKQAVIAAFEAIEQEQTAR